MAFGGDVPILNAGGPSCASLSLRTRSVHRASVAILEARHLFREHEACRARFSHQSGYRRSLRFAFAAFEVGDNRPTNTDTFCQMRLRPTKKCAAAPLPAQRVSGNHAWPRQNKSMESVQSGRY
jgi:hypothetical protein